MLLINFWNPAVPEAKREALTRSILGGSLRYPGEGVGQGLADDGHGDAREEL